MAAVLNNRLVRKFGLWYLAYEVVSLVVFLAFGAHFTSIL